MAAASGASASVLPASNPMPTAPTPRSAAHGYIVVFQSAATNLVTGDGNGVQDVFAHMTCAAVFSEFGAGLAGSGGYVPHLFGTDGSCYYGFTLSIADGVGFAPGLLWVGLGQSDLPLFGGHFYIDLSQFFVPIPVLLDGVVGQAGQGTLTIEGDDLTDYGGLTAYLQLLLVDAGAVRGVALSNGLTLDLQAR